MNFIKDKDDKLAQEYANNLPNNQEVAKEILKMLNNKETKVILDKEIKDSYYVFLSNKIYIADNSVNNSLYTRIILIAHECIHSVQSKVMQILNYMFSNIEILMFLLVVLIKFITKYSNYVILLSYLAVTVLSITFRLILEIDAVKRSVILGPEYVSTNLGAEQAMIIEKSSKKYIFKYFPLFIASLCISKVARTILAVILYIFF